MIRGRKSLSPAVQVMDNLGPLTPAAAAEEAAGKALDMAALEQASVLVSTGRIQTFQFLQKLTRVAAAKEFERVRDSKEYKNLPYRDASGNMRRVADLDEYCEAFLGRSYRAVAEDCQNLHVLGDELYEHALGLGLTTRNFREIRALPKDDQELVKEALETKSRDAVIEILETVISKHAKEKLTYEKRIKGLEGDLEAQRKVTLKKDEKLNALDAKLHKRMADLPAQLQELQIDCTVASGAIIDAVQKFSQIRNQAVELTNGQTDSDTLLGTVGVTHLQMLWQAQAWLTEELDIAESIFGGSKVEIRMQGKNGPDLTGEEIMNLRNAGAEESIRVAGQRVAETIIERSKKKSESAE